MTAGAEVQVIYRGRYRTQVNRFNLRRYAHKGADMKTILLLIVLLIAGPAQAATRLGLHVTQEELTYGVPV